MKGLEFDHQQMLLRWWVLCRTKGRLVRQEDPIARHISVLGTPLNHKECRHLLSANDRHHLSQTYRGRVEERPRRDRERWGSKVRDVVRGCLVVQNFDWQSFGRRMGTEKAMVRGYHGQVSRMLQWQPGEIKDWRKG
jgi:hypothetical protein